MDVSLAEGQRTSKICLAINGALALAKLLTGIFGHSYALIADAIESLGDLFSSAIVWGGLVIAARPADHNHPYGHGKAEPLAALAVSAMLILAAVGIAAQAASQLKGSREPPAPYTLVVLAGVIIVKESMYRLQKGAAERTQSTAVIADAWHHRGDALTSAAAAVGITIALLGGEGYEIADDWAALVACLIIVANGLRFMRMAVLELMDTSPRTDLADRIRVVALEVDGARFVEKVLVRKTGPRMWVDLHLEVDPELTVSRAHDIAHSVKDLIMDKWPNVADVLVHVEPHSHEGSNSP
ncbi:MAG: cation diffusion facilitator family transporter [Phycisphaerae bacterium]